MVRSRDLCLVFHNLPVLGECQLNSIVKIYTNIHGYTSISLSVFLFDFETPLPMLHRSMISHILLQDIHRYNSSFLLPVQDYVVFICLIRWLLLILLCLYAAANINMNERHCSCHLVTYRKCMSLLSCATEFGVRTPLSLVLCCEMCLIAVLC